MLYIVHSLLQGEPPVVLVTNCSSTFRLWKSQTGQNHGGPTYYVTDALTDADLRLDVFQD